jgi:hypothetical protein
MRTTQTVDFIHKPVLKNKEIEEHISENGPISILKYERYRGIQCVELGRKI